MKCFLRYLVRKNIGLRKENRLLRECIAEWTAIAYRNQDDFYRVKGEIGSLKEQLELIK